MKLAFRGASGAALIIGLAGGLQGAWAQQTQTVPTTTPTPQTTQATTVDQTAPAQEGQQATDRVVVTGSFIATAPEDAPKPVEVYTADDLQNQGAPSVVDFIRSLSVSASSGIGFGQTNPEVLAGSGFANVDLRGQGSNATLVLMNGRRMATTNGGFGADINTVPMEALEAVEILKDGASATYGAGAVGGVVNFRTRRDIDAPQVTVETTQYDGSQSYKVDFLTGWVGDASNFLISASHFDEDPLEATERAYSSLPFDVNPGTYTLTATNPGRFQPTFAGVGGAQIGATNFYTSATQTVLGGVNDYYGGSASTLAGVTAQGRAACEAIGGFIAADLQGGTSVTTPTGCAYPEFLFNQLVSDQTTDRVFAEFNADLTETMEFHIDTLYSKSETIAVAPPTGGPNAPVMDNSVSVAACQLAQSCYYVIPRRVQTFTTAGAPTGSFVANPFMADFLARTGTNTGPTGALYTSSAFRPYFFGGNPLFEDGRERQTFHRERFQVNVGLKGEFQSESLLSFLNGISYDYAGQVNQYSDTRRLPDIFKSRLQNALLGYGGPNCEAVDRVPTDFTSAATYNRTIGIQSDTAPGTDGCEFFNPFASAWATSIANGAANPQYGGAAFENSLGMASWLTHEDRTMETQYQSATFDFLWTGTIPETVFELPGGEIGWAAGTQWRQTERRDMVYSDVQDEEQMINQLCPFPDQAVVEDIDPNASGEQVGPADQPGSRGCRTTQGAYYSGGRLTTPPNFVDSQTLAYFAELQLPVTDRLNFSASVRREEFNGGDITGDIWSVAGKYDITDNFYFRGSYGTNFRAEAALDLVPGTLELDTFNGPSAIFGDNFLINRGTTVASDLGIEEDTTLNLGVGYQGDIGEGRLRAAIDFFEIVIDGEVQTTSSTTIVNNVFGGQPGVGTSAVEANCAAALIAFVDFGGACVQGVTTAQDILRVNRFILNGPGFITNGFDYTLDYSHPLFDGTGSFNLTATQNTVYKVKGYDVNGVPFQADANALGFDNILTGSGASPSQEWRGNATLRWANDRHNVSLRANYVGGMIDNRSLALFAPLVNNPGTANDTFSTYGVAADDYVDFDFNYIWTAPFWEELELRFSVLNLTDEDPMPYQTGNGYYSGVGDPRGRRFEFGATKRF